MEHMLSDKAADEVFIALTGAWDNDRLADLTARLRDYLNEKRVPPPAQLVRRV
jgi:hypothetical protein